MSKLALDPINLLQSSGSPTGAFRTGDTYFDSSANAIYVYNGTTWVQNAALSNTQTFTAGQTITPSGASTALVVNTGAAGNKGLVIKGFAGQSTNLQEWQNSAGTVIAKVDSSGNLTAASIIPTSSTVPTNGMYLPAANTVGLATNGLKAFSFNANREFDIGGNTPAAGSGVTFSKNITGATTANAFIITDQVASDVTVAGRLFRTFVDTTNVNFALPELSHIYLTAATAFQNVTAGGSVTNQYGVYVAASLTGATNNYGFFGNIPSGANRWNLYMAGTAYNFLAGITSIGSNSQTLGSGSVAQQFGVVSAAATTVGAAIRGAVSQTANLQEWQNSAGTALVAVGANGTIATGTTAGAPTIASAATIAPVTPIAFVSGVTTINTITPPAPISTNGGQITLIPTGIFTTGVSGNIAIASTAVVSKALTLTYDPITTKWYPSY